MKKGRPSEVITLTIHDWFGNIMTRIRGKTNDKVIGVSILTTVRDLFGLTDKIIQETVDKMNKELFSETDHFPKPFSSDWKQQKKPFEKESISSFNK